MTTSRASRPRKICLATWARVRRQAEVAAERPARSDSATPGTMSSCSSVNRGQYWTGWKSRTAVRGGPDAVHRKMELPLYWLTRRNLIRVLHRERPDLIHANDLPTHAMIADAARRVGIPRLCHHRFIFPRSALDWMNKFGAERAVYVSRYLMNAIGEESESLRSGARRSTLRRPSASARANVRRPPESAYCFGTFAGPRCHCVHGAGH